MRFHCLHFLREHMVLTSRSQRTTLRCEFLPKNGHNSEPRNFHAKVDSSCCISFIVLAKSVRIHYFYLIYHGTVEIKEIQTNICLHLLPIVHKQKLIETNLFFSVNLSHFYKSFLSKVSAIPDITETLHDWSITGSTVVLDSLIFANQNYLS